VTARAIVAIAFVFGCSADGFSLVGRADPAPSVVPDDPMPLVEKQWAALGGRAMQRSIQSRVVVAETLINGISTTVIEKTKAPDDLLIIVLQERSGIGFAIGFDGTLAWASDGEGPARVLSGAEAKDVECAAISANSSALFSDAFHEVYELKSERMIGGRPYFVLNSRVNDCPELDSYIDARTYLTRMVAYTDGVHTGVYVSGGFLPGPLAEPFPRFRTSVGPFGPTTTSAVTSLKENADLPDYVFYRPPFIVRGVYTHSARASELCAWLVDMYLRSDRARFNC
jgi:hypothetical protein